MQPGGNSLLLHLLKPVCPTVFLFLVYAEEELPEQRDSFLWCPLLLEGLKPTRKKGLIFIAVLTGCCPGLASGKRLRRKVLSGKCSHAVLLLLFSPKVVV